MKTEQAHLINEETGKHIAALLLSGKSLNPANLPGFGAELLEFTVVDGCVGEAWMKQWSLNLQTQTTDQQVRIVLFDHQKRGFLQTV